MGDMSRLPLITLFFALFCVSFLPLAFASESGEVQVWTFEVDDYVEEPAKSKVVKLKARKDIILDEITPDYKPKARFRADLTPNAKPLLYQKTDTSGEGLNVKRGNFSLNSTSRKTKNDYFENALNQRTEARYSKKYFEVGAGYETKYDNPDASLSTKNVFLSPKINISEEVSLILNNRVDPMGTRFEQEVGLNFKPKFLPNSIFGVTGGTTIRNNSGETTRKMKFSTDLLLW